MNDKTYWIRNTDVPISLWKVSKKNKDEEGIIFDEHAREWMPALSTFRSLSNVNDIRQIPKREARSLFPLAFSTTHKGGEIV